VVARARRVAQPAPAPATNQPPVVHPSRRHAFDRPPCAPHVRTPVWQHTSSFPPGDPRRPPNLGWGWVCMCGSSGSAPTRDAAQRLLAAHLKSPAARRPCPADLEVYEARRAASGEPYFYFGCRSCWHFNGCQASPASSGVFTTRENAEAALAQHIAANPANHSEGL